jgi:hypothetical protein
MQLPLPAELQQSVSDHLTMTNLQEHHSHYQNNVVREILNNVERWRFKWQRDLANNDAYYFINPNRIRLISKTALRNGRIIEWINLSTSWEDDDKSLLSIDEILFPTTSIVL